jgi:FKBP-type peptidyl-prolyl cis-trans isomerase FkpA
VILKFNNNMKKLLIVSTLALILSGCLKNDSDNTPQQCTYDSCAVKAPPSEIQNLQAYLSANSITATQHCSGLFYSVEASGSGTTPTACSYLSVKYVGKFTNGAVFDQTTGSNVASFNLSEVIRGWTNGIPYIKPGGKIHLYIPPTLGYGNVDRKDAAGNVVVPANSILIFDVELVAVY